MVEGEFEKFELGAWPLRDEFLHPLCSDIFDYKDAMRLNDVLEYNDVPKFNSI